VYCSGLPTFADVRGEWSQIQGASRFGFLQCPVYGLGYGIKLAALVNQYETFAF
jgi:hypothetical protein